MHNNREILYKTSVVWFFHNTYHAIDHAAFDRFLEPSAWADGKLPRIVIYSGFGSYNLHELIYTITRIVGQKKCLLRDKATTITGMKHKLPIQQ